MGVGDKLRQLDERAEELSVRRRAITERTALRLGMIFFIAAVAFMFADIAEPSFGPPIFSSAFVAGLFIGRLTEAKAIRQGKGALRRDSP